MTTARALLALLAALVALATARACAAAAFVVPPARDMAAAPYPEWAHHHQVWLSADRSTQDADLEFVQSFLDHGIPVGAVDIDSQWATADNDFTWNTAKFPNASDMIAQFHAKGVRVICWATSLIDTDSPTYDFAKSKDYLLDGGRTVHWWHGDGAYIDYTNPDALQWWHDQLDGLLDIGLDGWKCDGTDPYLFEFVIAHGHAGFITEREYADMYYRDFFYHSQSKNPEALIWARPMDSFGDLYFEFAPRDVMYSGWVGDQDPTFDGLKKGLENMFHSAWHGYANFGTDIGGYRHGPPPLGRTKELFTRWFQMGTFCPLMENGGNGEHRPWIFGNDTLDTYRTFVQQHMELVPYFLATGSAAIANNKSSITPLASETLFTPLTFEFLLGANVLVAPVLDNGTSVTVEFPKGAQWVDWWTPSNVYSGGSSVTYSVPMSSFPVFHRAGAITPLRVSTDCCGHGSSASEPYTTLLIDRPHTTRGDSFDVVEQRGGGFGVRASFAMPDDATLELRASAHATTRSLFLVRGLPAPARKALDNYAPSERRASCEEVAARGSGWASVRDAADEWRVCALARDATRGALLTVHF